MSVILTIKIKFKVILINNDFNTIIKISFSLNDAKCEAFKVELSPQLSIGVISDDLERVILFEVNNGGIIRYIYILSIHLFFESNAFNNHLNLFSN